MKKILTLICTLLCANVLLAQTTFWIGDIQYEITSTNPAEVKVNDADSWITTANIPETVTYNETTYSVTSIGDEAFKNCSSLTSVTIPNSVTSIGYRAFSNCISLTSVNIPNSVTSIGERAFSSCGSLTFVTIPNSVTSIGGGVFHYCSSLTSVTLSNNITELPCYYEYGNVNHGFFDGCSSLISITIPNSVTSIGRAAFRSCSNLTSVTCLGSNSPSLGGNVFDYTPNNKTLTIPCGCESEYAGWQNATTWASIDCIVTIGSLFTIGDLTYEVTEVTSETEVKVQDCTQSATSVVIPETVTYQGTTYSVTTIGERAFAGCSNLTSVTIPNSVTSIGGGVFYNCSGLSSVTLSNNITELPCYVDDNGYYYGFFSGCSSLTSVTIPNSITSIGYQAFFECSNLTSVTIPNSVTYIGDDAFAFCSSLTSITIPNSVTSIGHQAFFGCSSLTSVTIPNSVTSIGGRAFWGCSSLTSVTIPNSVTSIGDYAFRGCSSLTSVTCLSETAPILAEEVYLNTPNEKNLIVPCGALDNYINSYWNDCFANIIEEIDFTITANVNNSAFGSVAVESDCSTSTATLTATANEGYVFLSWNDGNTENPRVVSLTSDTAFTAIFALIDESSLLEAEAESISFFPNPTKSEITFSQAIEKVEVIDLTGKAILTFTNAKTINIESLPAGAYYLRLTNNDKAIMRKVIKQ